MSEVNWIIFEGVMISDVFLIPFWGVSQLAQWLKKKKKKSAC